VSAKAYDVTIDGKRYNVKTEKVQNVEFANVEHLRQIFWQKSSNSDIDVNVVPSSFFVSITQADNRFVLQLTTPPIEIRDKLYVPIESFTSALANVFECKYDVMAGGIFIETDSLWKAIFAPPKNISVDSVQIAMFSARLHHFNAIYSDFVLPKIKCVHLMDKTLQTVDITFEKIENIDEPITPEYPALALPVANSQVLPIEIADTLATYEEHIERPIPTMSERGIIRPSLRELSYKTKDTTNSVGMKTNSVNKALPPFRKYAVPDGIKKRNMLELGN
jgi:hypothetical protein